jgi:hypothetical protein
MPDVPNISDKSNVNRGGLIPYDIQPIGPLAAGEIREVPVRTELLFLSDATDTTGVQISFEGSKFVPLALGLVVEGFRGNKIYVKNTSASPNTVQLGLGAGSIRDTRKNVGPPQQVSIADGADVALGAKADAAATTDTGTFSLIALFKRLLTLVSAGFIVRGPATQDTVLAVASTQPVIIAGKNGNTIRVPQLNTGSVLQVQHYTAKSVDRQNFSALVATQVYASVDTRTGISIYNEGPGDLLILLGTVGDVGTISATNYTIKIPAGGYYETPFGAYAGTLQAMFLAAGTARMQSYRNA